MYTSQSLPSNSLDYAELLRKNICLIDVRAPVEFKQGAMPCAINLPLMFDDERAAVGSCYKQHGQQAAVTLGHKLVSGATLETRLADWLDACKRYPAGYLCCARGGLRSHIVQQWLRENGVEYPLVIGGYKALRHYALQLIDDRARWPMIIISGNTGCGKTLLINALPTGIDLEGLAHHRGSSFGRLLMPQPTQANFENQLAVALLKKSETRPVTWIVEDEGRMIGSRHIPASFKENMMQSSIVVIDDPFERRLERLTKEYFQDMWQAFYHADTEEKARKHYSDYLHHGIFSIRRRLGQTRFLQFSNDLNLALKQQWHNGSCEGHLAWLVPLLKEYYDPMYRYQLEKKAQNIRFRGNWEEVHDWLRAQ